MTHRVPCTSHALVELREQVGRDLARLQLHAENGAHALERIATAFELLALERGQPGEAAK